MTNIALPFSIARDQKTGKKLYVNLKTKETTTSPKGMPKWKEIPTGNQAPSPSYAIRPDDDLVVIDCDDLESTEAIYRLVLTSNEHYIVESDKGEKHYYFRPTPYYISSTIYSKTRIKVGKHIDILHGESLVYAVCPLNLTKQVFQGTIQHITPMPDDVVDYLVSQLQIDRTTTVDEDYSPVTSYMGPQLDAALAQYARTKAYSTLQSVIALLTPKKFRQDDCHPNNVQNSDGHDYILGIRAKLGRDPSISLAQTQELLTIITQELWEDPLDSHKLNGYLADLETAHYPNGKRVFVYDPNATSQPLVSANSNPYMPVYRTIEDQYVITLPEGGVEIHKGLSNFKRAMQSPNYKMLINSEEVSNIGLNNATSLLQTVTLVNMPTSQPGSIVSGSRLLYNTYQPTRYLGIIRGDYLADKIYQPSSTPTIDTMLGNLFTDHEDSQKRIDNFLGFIARKLKTLEHSALVFYFNGIKGNGKNNLLSLILSPITGTGTPLMTIDQNTRFNAEMDGVMFAAVDEVVPNKLIVNTLKKWSGDREFKIEAKGRDAKSMPNTVTMLVFGNTPFPLAETYDDRRFVTNSSFKSNRLIDILGPNVQDLGALVASELEQFCLKLRDTPMISNKLYLDANAWHDDIHISALDLRSEKTQDPGKQIAALVNRLDTYNSNELFEELERILGHSFHYKLAAGCKLNIPLQNRTARRHSDGAYISNTLTKSDIEINGLAQYLKEDKNLKVYDKRYYYLQLLLFPQQLDRFNEEIVEPLEV